MKQQGLDRITVVIRTCGERTENLCHELVLAQGVPPDNAVVVRASPFSAAMRRSFATGIEHGRPWTLCIDADVLLRPGSIARLMQSAEEQHDSVCEVQGFVLDKFLGGPRQAGNHLYRTRLLDKVIRQIPAEGVDLRPETYTLQAMAALGHPWVTVPVLVGLHDFEQYYRDIFRKFFVHAHKHADWTSVFVALGREGAKSDAEYRVALHGLAAGIVYFGSVRIDSEQEINKAGVAALDVVEKAVLPVGTYTLDSIEEIIAHWVEPEPYLQKFPGKMGLAPVDPVPLAALSHRKRFAHQMKLLGPFSMIPYTIGWILSRVGKQLQSWASGRQC